MIKYFALVMMSLALFSGPGFASPQTGQPAPQFTGTDTKGNSISLSDYLGYTIILEWSNHECPYVKKHYESNNMQSLQKEMTDKGIIWITIVSSAKDMQGYTTPEQATAIMDKSGALPTALILDPSGKIGSAYDARTTPHMYVINSIGTLVYMGAIDDSPGISQKNVFNARNFVRESVKALENGEEIKISETRPYGCSVKYSVM